MAIERDASVRSVLQNRYFLALWLAQVLSQTAQNAIFYTLLVFIEERTGSTIHVSFLILSAIIPSILFGVGAGVLVDHVPKKSMLVTTNALRAVAVLGFLVFNQTFALLYFVNFVFMTISQFFAPAEAASIPMLVKRNQLIAANGLFNITMTTAQLAGFVLFGPPLVKFLGPEVSFVVIAAIFAVCTVLVSFLPAQEPEVEPLSKLRSSMFVETFVSEVRSGWQLLRGEAVISLAMVHLTFASSLMLVLAELAPGFVSRVVGIRADDAVFVLAPAGVGIVIGTLALPAITSRVLKHRVINFGLFVMALCLAFLGLAKNAKDFVDANGVAQSGLLGFLATVQGLVGLIMVVTLIIGFAYALINIPAQTTLMQATPVQMRGRIFAIQIMFGFLAAVFPLLFMASLADVLGITLVLFLVATGVLSVYVFSLYQTRKVLVVYSGEPTTGVGKY